MLALTKLKERRVYLSATCGAVNTTGC